MSTQHKAVNIFKMIIKLSFGITIICALISVPLLMVYKQVFITDTSLERDMLCDSVETLKRRVLSLQVICENLSEADRIERIAHEALGFVYPGSDKFVVVVPKEHVSKRSTKVESPFWAMIRKSITPEKS